MRLHVAAPGRTRGRDDKLGPAMSSVMAGSRRCAIVVLGLLACNAEPRAISGDGGAGASDARASDAHSPDPASCVVSAAGTTDCGPDGESCCTSLAVPPGSYDRTYTNDGGGPAAESDPATVSGFRLDKYLVTVGRFRQFVAASAAGWVPAAGSGKHAHLNGGLGLSDSGGSGYEPGWDPGDSVELATTQADWMSRLSCEPNFQTWTDTAGPARALADQLRRLVRGVRVLHLGRGLLAERGGVGIRGGGRRRAARVSVGLDRIPEWTPTWRRGQPLPNLRLQLPGRIYDLLGLRRTSRPSARPRWARGAGASSIWPESSRSGPWIRYAPYVDPCVDCVYLTDFSYRVVRGGSFGTDTEDVFPPARDGDVPGSRNAFYGFRCARSP